MRRIVEAREGKKTYNAVLGTFKVGIGNELAYGIEHLLELLWGDSAAEPRRNV